MSFHLSFYVFWSLIFQFLSFFLNSKSFFWFSYSFYVFIFIFYIRMMLTFKVEIPWFEIPYYCFESAFDHISNHEFLSFNSKKEKRKIISFHLKRLSFLQTKESFVLFPSSSSSFFIIDFNCLPLTLIKQNIFNIL